MWTAITYLSVLYLVYFLFFQNARMMEAGMQEHSLPGASKSLICVLYAVRCVVSVCDYLNVNCCL